MMEINPVNMISKRKISTLNKIITRWTTKAKRKSVIYMEYNLLIYLYKFIISTFNAIWSFNHISPNYLYCNVTFNFSSFKVIFCNLNYFVFIVGTWQCVLLVFILYNIIMLNSYRVALVVKSVLFWMN